MAISPNTLDVVLSALNDELGLLDAPTHLVVVGGSAMLAIGAVARATQDVDVVARVSGNELLTADPLPDAVREAAASVARNFALPKHWLNGGPTSLLEPSQGLPEGFAARVVRRRFGHFLTVDFAGRFDLIHFKLYALADRDAPRDRSDLLALKPSLDEIRAAARWARTHNMPGPFDDDLRRALKSVGFEDEGRAG